MKNMLKGKNLLLLALVGGGAYWYWNKMKKEKEAKAATPAKAAEAAANGMPYVNAFGLNERQRRRIERRAKTDIDRATRVANRIANR